MSITFVTGTSTGVGKTVTTAALASVLTGSGSVAVCKPAQTGLLPGEPGDIADVVRLAGAVTTVELARYPEPLAPDTAARRAGMPLLRCGEVVESVRELAAKHDHVLVEGAGGVLVRLGEGGFTLADVAAGVRDAGVGEVAAVVVVDPALGALNHAELTVRALRSAGVRCAGLVIGAWPGEPDLAMRCNLDDLPAVTGVPVIGRLPEGAGAMGRAEFAAEARRRCAPGLAAHSSRSTQPRPESRASVRPPVRDAISPASAPDPAAGTATVIAASAPPGPTP
ncbi:dethiobiotin synthase [Tomitella fengzijianii]|uniref:dethiobiotin synthase n=1 Tax=Tomitella fengzijianii TaxID=2597660 RepID=UPI0018EF0394|nr:dethiobiotin synthase [Tomitella fengzijianii]